MTATHSLDSTASASSRLYLALELSSGRWKLASTTSRGQVARLVSVPARADHWQRMQRDFAGLADAAE